MLRSSLRRKRRCLIALALCLAFYLPLAYVIPNFSLCDDGGGCGADFPCRGNTGRPRTSAKLSSRCIEYAECEAATGLSRAQCDFWRSEANATLTELPVPRACAACSVLDPLAAITQYMVITCLLVAVAVIGYHDLSHDPTTGERYD